MQFNQTVRLSFLTLSLFLTHFLSLSRSLSCSLSPSETGCLGKRGGGKFMFEIEILRRTHNRLNKRHRPLLFFPDKLVKNRRELSISMTSVLSLACD